ncbi:hypothetical protein [Stratiformator vulcanicus]|uniref:hypothetical protein n=1 Tax=Stratiformator vulcanicus TaxID=2527980 RepID=UPI00119E6078|nr:hypothetical protein [Stratiformator vulcanicus]
MNLDSIRTVLTAQPFRPFEVVTSSGDRHGVRHPETVAIAPGAMVVVKDGGRFHVLSPMHITELNYVDPSVAEDAT